MPRKKTEEKVEKKAAGSDVHEDTPLGVLGHRSVVDAPPGVLAGGTTGGGVTNKGAEPGVPQGGAYPGQVDPGEVISDQV